MTSQTTIPNDAVLADIQKTKSGFRVRVFWFAGIFTAIVFSLAIIAGWSIIVAIAPYLLIFIGLVTLIVVGVFVYEFVQGSATRHKKHDAGRRIVEARARQEEAAARAAEFFTYGRSEGVIRHTPNGLDVLALPAQVAPATTLATGDQVTELDFFSAMTQPKRCYGMRAGQQVGKTWLVHHIAAFWQARGIQPVVLSQKYDAGDYEHCLKYGTRPESIQEGFNVLQREADTRQQMADAGTRYDEMTLCPVVLEDWTSMGAIIGQNELEKFIGQALTVYAGRGILLYFVTHSNVKGAYGLGKLGASLKDQLTDIEILPFVADKTGIIDRSRNQVVASIASVCDQVPVVGIPTQAAILIGNCEPSLYSLAALPIALETASVSSTRPEIDGVTDKQQSRVLRLAGQDQSVSTISAIVFGETSKHNNGKVKQVLEIHGIVANDGRGRGPKYSLISKAE